MMLPVASLFVYLNIPGPQNFPEVICVYVDSLSPKSSIDITDYPNVLAHWGL